MMNQSSGYQYFNDNGAIHIKIDRVDLGSFKASQKANIMAYCGPRKTFMNHGCLFKRGEYNPKTVWNFQYSNPRRSTFVIALYKHRYLKPDSLIGEIELRVSGFQPNAVTTTQFTLNCPGCSVPANITLSVHVCENGSDSFAAPTSNTVSNNIVVQRRNCY